MKNYKENNMKSFQIIMPVFQTKSIFLICMQSLFQTIRQQTELIIINDGSGYNCLELLQNNIICPDILNIRYIEHEHSIGFAKSVNIGLDFVKDNTYVIFADSDIIFPEKWQEIVDNTLSDLSIGAVSGVFLYPQTGGIQCCGIAYQDYLARHIYLNNNLEFLSLEDIFDVQATIFAFLALRSDVIKAVGKLDERFFNGYDDVDYQMRLRKKGYRIVTNRSLAIYHFEKSNGVHRNFSRRQNLGLFWSKHANFIDDDLVKFVKKQLAPHLIGNKRFVLVNMCEAYNDSLKIINFLKSKLKIDSVLDITHSCNIENKLWIPELLSSDSYALPIPYIFLCDNFVELTENDYWLRLRSNYIKSDLIIDLYANVIPFHYLSNHFWPGNKIR